LNALNEINNHAYIIKWQCRQKSGTNAVDLFMQKNSRLLVRCK